MALDAEPLTEISTLRQRDDPAWEAHASLINQAGVRVRSLFKNSTLEELVRSTWSSSKVIPLPSKNSVQFNLNLVVPYEPVPMISFIFLGKSSQRLETVGTTDISICSHSDCQNKGWDSIRFVESLNCRSNRLKKRSCQAGC
jgi:hypothetical protein